MRGRDRSCGPECRYFAVGIRCRHSCDVLAGRCSFFSALRVSGFRVSGLSGFRVSRFRISRFRVSGFRFLGFRVSGLRV